MSEVDGDTVKASVDEGRVIVSVAVKICLVSVAEEDAEGLVMDFRLIGSGRKPGHAHSNANGDHEYDQTGQHRVRGKFVLRWHVVRIRLIFQRSVHLDKCIRPSR